MIDPFDTLQDIGNRMGCNVKRGTRPKLPGFAERLRAARQACGVTMRDAAEYIGLSKHHMQNYELGRREPSLAALAKIAVALGVTTDYLLDVQPPAADSAEE